MSAKTPKKKVTRKTIRRTRKTGRNDASLSKLLEVLRQLDSRVGALQLVVDDLLKGGVSNVTTLPGGGAQWSAYEAYYAKVVAGYSPEELTLETPTVEEEPESTYATVEFGGEGNG